MSEVLVKRENASELVLTVMLSAITSVLVTRFALEITDHFQLGRGPWHLAHVLWGGLAMFIGGMMPQLFHGDKVRKWGALIFGVGCGLFIDEIGKFLTRDNNYFFQPAILFIYGFFVLLFLLYRYLERINKKEAKTLIYQTLSELEEVAENDLEVNEKENILRRLALAVERSKGGQQLFAQHLAVLVEQLPAKTVNKKANWLMRVYKKVKWFSYYKIFRRKVVLYSLVIMAIGDIVSNIYTTYSLLIWRENGYNLASFIEKEVLFPRFDSYMVGGKMIVDILSSLLFFGGLFFVLRKKVRFGIYFFQTGLLVNIFMASLFNFYFEQFSAVLTLLVNLAILLGLSRFKRDYMVK